MKKLIAILTLLSIVSFSGSIFAQGVVKFEKAKGQIAAIDAIGNKLIVKEIAGEVTFVIEPTTKIIINNKEVKLADLKVNEKVSVRYKVVGTDKVAVEIK